MKRNHIENDMNDKKIFISYAWANKDKADTVNEEMKSIGGMLPNIPGLNL